MAEPVRIRVTVQCSVHGQMHHAGRGWVCHGFDGEGCTAALTYEQVMRANTSTRDHAEYWTVSPRPGSIPLHGVAS